MLDTAHLPGDIVEITPLCEESAVIAVTHDTGDATRYYRYCCKDV